MYKSIPKSSPIHHSFPTIFRQPNRFSNESKKFNRTQISAQVNDQRFKLENLPIENTNNKIIKIKKIKNKVKIFKKKKKNLNKTDTIQTHLFSYDFSTTKQILIESKEI